MMENVCIIFLGIFGIFLSSPVGVFCQEKNVIDLENGAYSNVLIAIQSDVKENDTIVENLKTTFTLASERLYQATRKHVHWGHIKILVPASWSRKPDYGVAMTESFETANVVIHDFENDRPYVENPFGCGREGLAMHITPTYIQDPNHLEDLIGPPDKVLVQQWAFYRWGLFEEYYDESHYDLGAQPGYSRPGQGGGPSTTEGTRCSREIQGQVLKNSNNGDHGKVCKQKPFSTSFERECVFVPDEEGQTATASLLFDTSVDSIDGFCDDDTSDQSSAHNAESPSLHNKHCMGWSAWRVMREKTNDFVDGPQGDLRETTPVFDIIQAPAHRSVVLVLDTSGSMGGANRFVKLIQSSVDYILNIIPEGSQLGIVGFTSSAITYAPLTLITDDETRQNLVDSLPPSAGGGTSIGSGVLQGIQVLGSYAAGGYMLLLSDGYGGEYPYIVDTYDEVDASGVIIDTIAISDQADPEMETLSTMTNGIPAFCSDADSGSCIVSAFQATITTRPDVGTSSSTSVPFQILNADLTISINPGFVIVPVVIDADLGNDTVFSVTWAVNSLVNVEVSGPGGILIVSGDPRFNIDMTSRIISVKIADAAAGQWTLTVSTPGPGTERASVSITSKPRSADTKPVSVKVILGSRNVDHSADPFLNIYAQVQRGYQPVVGASVEAVVANSLGEESIVALLDNGSGADLLKADGLYSAYFLNFSANGRYNVKVDAFGLEEEIFSAGSIRRGRRAGAKVQNDTAPSFMRTASGGAFEVESYVAGAGDQLAPARIHDLQCVGYSYDNSTVTLQWTAVGDDLDQGTAFRYEMRYATNFTEITDLFEYSRHVTNNITVEGNLSSVASPGVVEKLVIKVPERGDDVVYYFSIRTWDEAGNVGDQSNSASVVIIDFVPPTTTTTTTATSTTTSGGKQGTDKAEISLLILLSCLTTIVILMVIIMVGYHYMKKTDNKVAALNESDVEQEKGEATVRVKTPSAVFTDTWRGDGHELAVGAC